MQDIIGQSPQYSENVLGVLMALVAVLSLVAGVIVVVRERARRISLTLLAASVAVAVYLLGFSFMVRSTTAAAAAFWSSVAYLGVPFIVPALFQFSMELLGLREERRAWISAGWMVGLVYATLAVATDVLVAGVFETRWGYYTELTPWNGPFMAWSLVLLGLMIRDYWHAYRSAEPLQKARIRWLAIPLVIASVAFTDYLPSLGVEWPPVGFVFLTAFLLGAARVVARYHLPDLTPAFAADQILSTMAEPLLVVDPLGEIAITNPAAARLLGWSQEELEDRTLPVVLGTPVARQLTEGGRVQGRELVVEGRVGEPIAVSVSTSDLVERGRVLGTVIVMRDIRERKRAASRLRRREEHFRALIENARDTITVVDAEGRVMYQSPSHAEILGRDPGESVGASVFRRVHPDDLETAAREFSKLAAEPGDVAQAEIRMQHTDGEYRVMDLRGRNLLHHSAVQGVVINGRDVTEERRLSEELQQSQKLEAVGRLAGGIAHDFNNILTTIQGAVALMADEVPPDCSVEDELDVIRAGAERAGRLTSQLLAFGRRQVTRPKTLSPSDVIGDVLPELRGILTAEQRLTVHAPDQAGPVRMDRRQLEQVLTDLVMNARDAMDREGRAEITVEDVRIGEEDAAELPIDAGPYVRISVIDDGHGMDEETLQHIFDPFFSTKDESIGEGLGLASVYGAVRQAGGHVEVESRPGQGARFQVYLPRVTEPSRELDATGAGFDDTDADSRGRTVLVVEDEAPVRGLIKRVLEREGYQVLAAPDGEAALRVAAEHAGTIHLLIADLVMPGMSGREVAERLTAAHPTLSTILISGYTADEVVRDGISRGEYEFIPKPFDPGTLTDRVSEVLRERQPG